MVIGGYAASFRCVVVDEAAHSWRAKTSFRLPKVSLG
jgi:hypothetical protein